MDSLQTAPLLSANPPDVNTATIEADAAEVRRSVVKPLVDSGRDVLIFAHSFGGIVAGAAAYGLTTGQGDARSGVIGLIYHSAMMLPEGGSMEQMFGGQLPPFIVQDNGLSTQQGKTVSHATLAFQSPAPKGAWTQESLQGRLVYIRTMQDQGFTPDFQQAVISQSSAKWVTEDVDAPHEAYKTNTEEIVQIIEKYAALWQS